MPPGRLAPSRATGISASRVDAGSDAHALEHPHHVFGRHIAGRAGSKRAAAQAAERRIEHAHALPERGVDVGEPEAISIMRMEGPRASFWKPPHAGCEQALYVGGIGAPRGVAKADLHLLAHRDQAVEKGDGLLFGHPALEGAVERRGQVQPHRAVCWDRLQQAPVFLGRLQRMAADVVAVVRLRHREHEGDPRRAGLHGVLAAPLARRQDLRNEAGDAGAGGQQFGRVAQLRHGGGADKRADFDPMQASGHEPLQHIDLVSVGMNGPMP